LFTASGRNQLRNPGYLTLAALGIPLVPGAPHDDREQIAPRIGFAYSPGNSGNTLLRGGFGLYFNDLAQNGWVDAFQALNTPAGPCVDPIANPTGPENAGCVPGGGTAALIDPRYRTPYAIHISGGAQHAFNAHWSLGADYVHEAGDHAYRAYSYTGGVDLFTPRLSAGDPTQATLVPNAEVFHSDNRSSYNGLMLHLQGNAGARLSWIANYTFSKAQTWGCVLGELFDYVNGVCNPLNAFGPGDYGPSGEDVRQRFVLAATWRAPAGFEVSGLSQAESARPFTLTNADNTQRVVIGGTPTLLDQFRGTPYLQTDLRVARPIQFGDRWSVNPFVEFFNLFDRNNPGANYVTNSAALTGIDCLDTNCDSIAAPSNPQQLRQPGGALGDFFGPGTTVGIPFAAQLGVRVNF
jgi:hypothetical protein